MSKRILCAVTLILLVIVVFLGSITIVGLVPLMTIMSDPIEDAIEKLTDGITKG